MVFTKFIEVGRLCLINYGNDEGKLCVIIDVVDNNRVLVDGPESLTGVSRQAINMKRLAPTALKIDITRGARVKQLLAALKKEDALTKFRNSRAAKVMEIRKARAEAVDFDRFKLMIARKAKGRAINNQIKAIKKAVPAAGKKA